MTELEAMRRALELALKGWGRVAPNPLVGAVLLKDGAIVGEGYHAEFGEPHAEVVALQSCAAPGGTTCVVTLEPCNHHGKTPPCTDALMTAGVARVVYAVDDPHRGAAGGAARLKAAGIAVGRGLLAGPAAALNAPFLWSQRRASRPFVAVKVATSLDGYTADHMGRSRWISGDEARDWVHWLRAGFDAIAVGRQTAVDDDPELTVRGPVAPRVPPVRVVLSRGAMLSPNLTLVRTASDTPTLFITVAAAARVATQELAGTGVQVLAAEDLADALGVLRWQGLRSVLVEGGGRIVNALLAAGLVDRLYWVQAPIWLGKGRPAFGELPATALGAARRWTVTERKSLGDDTLLVVDRELCLPAS